MKISQGLLMVIILKNLTANTKKQDIKNFIIPHVKGGMLSKSGNIKDISILKHKDVRLNMIVYHALVDISPDSVAERVIKKLHRKSIGGKYIAINRYFVRNSRNDPRRNKLQTNHPLNNKRLCDRRNQYEEILSETFSFTSDRIFHRKIE